MKRESNSMTRGAEEEFERRMEEFFSEIFPQHAQCGGSCRGHQLPNMARKFLKEMGYPADLKDLTIAAVSWYERIDLDASGSIDRCKVCMLTGARARAQTRTRTQIWWERQHRHVRMLVYAAHTRTHSRNHTHTHVLDTHTHAHTDRAELTKEFERIGITASAASSLWTYHDADGNDMLNVREFHDMVLHILENVHATFSAADMLALGCLINEYDKDGSETLDIVEFKALASDLVKKNFLFTGREGPDTLDLNQLYVLREYNWKRRKMQKLEDVDVKFTEGRLDLADDQGPDNRQDQINAMINKFDVEKQPSEGEEAPKEPEPIYVITNAQKEKLVQACTLAKTLSDTCFPDLRERADALQHNSKDLLPLTVELKKRIHDALQRELKKHANARGFESLFDHTQNANYVLYLQVERCETELHGIFLEHVSEIAAILHKEGVIEVPTLEWDGSLGREEEVAIGRLGFLLNA